MTIFPMFGTAKESTMITELSPKDLDKFKKAFGDPDAESLTTTFAEGFFSGMVHQTGYCTAETAYTLSSSSGPQVILCKSRGVTKADLKRNMEILQRTEHQLQEAEIAKNKAIDAYKNTLKEVFGNVEIGIKLGIPTEVTAKTTVGELAKIASAKNAESKACTHYDNVLFKYAQEKALVSRLEREVAGQPGIGSIVLNFAGGVFSFIVTVISKRF